jgi:diguanylate cyclase (GGDEF)-like protein
MFGEVQAGRRLPCGVSNCKPVEELELAAERLLDENRMLRAVIDNFPGGILLYDKNLKLVLCNEQQKKLLDYPPALFEYGLPTLEQIFRFNAVRGEYGPGDTEQHVQERMRLAAKREAHVFERVRPNGTVLEVRGQPLSGGGFVTTYLDVTDLRKGKAPQPASPQPAPAPAAPPPIAQPNHDPLTGLPNWLIFEDRFAQILARVKRGHVAAVHYIDLDHFRNAQSTLGPELSMRFLRMVADRLRNVARTTDTLARLGDDEFIVLQSDVDRPSSVAKLAHRLVDAVKLPYEVDKYRVAIGASVGIALAPRDGMEAETLIAKAREALDRARNETAESITVNDASNVVAGV